MIIGLGWTVSAWLAQALGPVVRIDHGGIAFRALWFWHLWAWNEFSKPGKIVPASSGAGYVLTGTWHPMTVLSLNLLGESDIEEIDSLIQSVLALPEDRLPESINFKEPWLSLELTTAGIRYTHKRINGECEWSTVRRVEIWRSAHGRRDFRNLTIDLPDKLLEVDRVDGYQKRVALCDFLIRHVEQDRLHEFAISGPAQSTAEIDARISRLQTLLDAESSDIRFAGVALAALTIVAVCVEHWWKVLTTLAVFSPMALVAIHFFRHKRWKQRVELAELERQRKQFQHVQGA